MSLAEISDLEDLLGSTVDQARAQKLLHDASATVVAYTGQQFTRSGRKSAAIDSPCSDEDATCTW